MPAMVSGRCAIAIDGRVVAVARDAVRYTDMHVILAGNSVDARILVGHLRVGTALAGGIRWDEQPPD
jgi:hypothetical protein